MIESAEEFVRLRNSWMPEEYRRAAAEEAPLEVWAQIIERHPDMRFWVAQNKTVPLAILEVLRHDPDKRVQSMVRRNRSWARAHPEDATRGPGPGLAREPERLRPWSERRPELASMYQTETVRGTVPSARWFQPEHELTRLCELHLAHLDPRYYNLRADDRWVRFHSLPQSRRYPDQGAGAAVDWAELLHRHTTLIRELADLAPAKYLYRPVWDDDDLASECNGRWHAFALAWHDWALVRDPDEEDDTPPLKLVVAVVDWPATWSEAWLRATADEELAGGVLVAEDASWLAAPYAGGIDLVAPSPSVREGLIRRYRPWPPLHGDL
ncbi:MAG: hypothetical protein M3P48_02925 [Actinomycetota bacterium]|nr:hypothetical protein [Actinomycetota bacterium]